MINWAWLVEVDQDIYIGWYKVILIQCSLADSHGGVDDNIE